jgi:hypothetical protein
MNRIDLFEFEDFPWFPDWIRTCVTHLIVVMHKLLNTSDDLVPLIKKALNHSKNQHIVDLCSGSGGPMITVYNELVEKQGINNLKLTLTDLYPNQELASTINNPDKPNLSYKISPVDAANVPTGLSGIRTMIGSFHHMKPDTAKKILKDAKDSKVPICIYEISDNAFPTFLWWATLPILFLMALFITPFVKPLTLKQIAFTYIIPIIPFVFAWDGAVSNARTYNLKDLTLLITGLKSEDYTWEMGKISKRGNKVYLLGLPAKS